MRDLFLYSRALDTTTLVVYQTPLEALKAPALAKDRIALAKLMKGAEGAAAKKAESLTVKAMQDAKLATLCLKYVAL